jgi:hypothetical protein
MTPETMMVHVEEVLPTTPTATHGMLLQDPKGVAASSQGAVHVHLNRDNQSVYAMESHPSSAQLVHTPMWWPEKACKISLSSTDV